MSNLSQEINEIIAMYTTYIEIDDTQTPDEDTWLMKKQKTIPGAAKDGDLIWLKYLIEDRNLGKPENINKALCYGAENGHLEIVQYLVEKGADIHVDNDYALLFSAENGHLDVVKYLIEKNGDLDISIEWALLLSAENGHLEVVKYLFELRDNSRIVNDILRSSARNGHLDVVKYLVEECGADIHSADECALCHSAENGHLDIVIYLVEGACTTGFVAQGADIHARNDYALLLSAENGHLDVVKYLIGLHLFPFKMAKIFFVIKLIYILFLYL
jgi:hypothetical protein